MSWGRIGKETEYRSYCFPNVEIVAQRTGPYWYVYVVSHNFGVFRPSYQSDYTKKGAIEFMKQVADDYAERKTIYDVEGDPHDEIYS